MQIKRKQEEILGVIYRNPEAHYIIYTSGLLS